LKLFFPLIVCAVIGIFYAFEVLLSSRFPNLPNVYDVPVKKLICCCLKTSEKDLARIPVSPTYKPPRRARYVHALTMFFTLIYTVVGSTALAPLNCQKQQDVYIMLSQTSIECFSADWYNHFPKMIAAILFYVFGIPTAFFILFFINRKEVRSPKFISIYGYLTSGYRENFYWWELVNFARKFVLLIIIYAASSADLLYMKIFVLIFFFLVLIFTQMMVNPYLFPMNNLSSFGWMLSAEICLFSGSIFSSNSISEVETNTFAGILIFCLATNLFFSVWTVFREFGYVLQIQKHEQGSSRSYYKIDHQQKEHVERYFLTSKDMIWDTLSEQVPIERDKFFLDLSKLTTVEKSLVYQFDQRTGQPYTRMRVPSTAQSTTTEVKEVPRSDVFVEIAMLPEIEPASEAGTATPHRRRSTPVRTRTENSVRENDDVQILPLATNHPNAPEE
jgi:hypothetical protein